MEALPTFYDVLEALQTISPYLPRTALYHYPSLGRELGAEVWVKHENHLPTGAFKVRGGVNYMAHLSPDERGQGILTASTGNHGQSVAFAAKLFGVRSVIVMPHAANPVKVEAIRGYGAEIRFVGRDFDDCRTYVEETAAREGLRYLSSGDEPLLIAGVGTQSLEIVETLPDIDVIVVPIGGGSGAAGACLVAKAVNPKIQVIGVQSAGAPGAYLSWKEKRRAAAPIETFAEGLATRESFDMPQAILRRDLHDFLLVSDDEIRAAMRLITEKTRNLVEAAGAASLAGALKIRERLTGKRVALIASGGNITLAGLRELLL
jgi:threonine dehydratase